MECPKCKVINPDGKKYCRECGAKLLLLCVQCGAETQPLDKFCGECGHNLSPPSVPVPGDLSFDEKISRIQKFLPEGLAEKILSQRDKIEGEKKQVTVLFCDMEAFTSVSEKLGPEGVYILMEEIYEILLHKVNEYGGTVNELTGDGIMALFGAPIALEDAPQRAIRSALAIHSEITRFSERVTRERGIPSIRMRAGIHSGPVVVGTVGNNLRVEFKALGDTVNLASRMESLAEPGTTYVTEDTFRLTEGLFRFEALGEKAVKGKGKPVKVYQVIAPSSRRTRFDVSAERGLTPFVGRERELELLLDGFERVKGSMGQAFSIISEAGVGKSRFLYEFRKAVANEDVTFLEGKCLSYGKAAAYHPVIDILKANFGIAENDTVAMVREKVARRLKTLEVDETTTLPYLLELLSVKDSGIDRILMSPEGRREGIIEALNRIVLKSAEVRPLILAVEDLHWTDKSSEEVFNRVLEAIPGTKVMVVFTYRPDYVHVWGGRSYHNQITLNRLSNRESLLLVSHLLGAEEIDPELQKLILAKTEGVPFFIEELVKSLQDLEIIKKEEGRVRLQRNSHSLAVPSTIQEIIMARVDRLPDPAKAVLQAGSVIEREFPHDLIAKVSGFPAPELLTYFSFLKEAELLYERGIYPRNSYIFRHALTREVVYSSILASKRKELHGVIAKAIEELHREDLTDYYEVLAEHFFECENFGKAAEYSRRSARKAQKGASPDAIIHARKRVLCLEKSFESREPGKELIDARTVLGLYLMQVNHPYEAMEAVEPVADLAREKGYKRRFGQIQTIRGAYYHFVDEDFQKAIRTYEEALGIAEEENHFITLVLANFMLGCAQGWNCDSDKARESIQKAIDINVMAKNLWGIAVTKATLAYIYCFASGRIDSMADHSLEALRIAQESGDSVSKGISQVAYGVLCYAKGNFEDSEKYLLAGESLCERMGLYSWGAVALGCLAEIYFEIREFQKSRERYDQANRFFKRIQIFPSWVRWGQLGMAKCGVMLGERELDLKSLRAIPEKNRIKMIEGWISAYLGEIFLNLGAGHAAEAERWICKAIEANERNGVRFHLGLNHALYAELHKRRRDKFKARENFGRAVQILKECGAEGWVDKYQKESAAL